MSQRTTFHAQTPLQALILEQALLLAQQLEITAQAAPDGQVLARVKALAVPVARELARQAVQATLQGQARAAEKKGRSCPGRGGCWTSTTGANTCPAVPRRCRARAHGRRREGWSKGAGAADERGDLYESANLSSFVGPLVRLVDDDVAGARQVLQSSVERWSPPGFHLQNVTALMADTYIDLYAGDFEAAWERWRRRWADVLGSHFLYVQVLRVFVHELHARTALAMASRSANPKPLLRAAEAGARRIERERLPWALPLAQRLRAGLATVRGDRATAADLLEQAAAGFEVAELRLFAMATRRRLADFGGVGLAAGADAWLTAQGVRNPERLAAALTPCGDV